MEDQGTGGRVITRKRLPDGGLDRMSYAKGIADKKALRRAAAGLRPYCPCGSGEHRSPLHDARGIFCRYVCSKRERDARASYRPDIFTDADYWHDEPIDSD